jgi:hypothetical protein
MEIVEKIIIEPKIGLLLQQKVYVAQLFLGC